MSPIRRGGATAPSVTSERLATATDTLTHALDTAGDALPAEPTRTARDTVAKVGERSRLSGDHTIVALAGATGSGKSSLFNALVGQQVSRIGATRPTTSKASAATWGPQPASDLLDWLGVQARHQVGTAASGEGVRGAGESGADGGGAGGGGDDELAGSLDGLVLLDLPDFDSRELAHRQEAERVLALADVFVWVTDPQKYADARMHDEFVALMSHHDAVTLVVLNQADRLGPEAAEACRQDLARLVEADGVRRPVVLMTSVRTGEGVPELKQRLASSVAGHAASRMRLYGDVRDSARRLRRHVADSEPDVRRLPRRELDDAVASAAGVPIVLDAVARDYRREAFSHTGWIFSRWTTGFSADPLRRLRLDRTGGRPAIEVDVDPAEVRAVLGRSSIPAPSAATRSRVQAATRQFVRAASHGLPHEWAMQVDDAATQDEAGMSDELDRAVMGTDLRARTPVWWHVLNALQWTLGVVAVVGFLWTALLWVFDALGFNDIPTPSWGWLPLPFIFMAGALLLGILLGLMARWWARVGARGRRQRIARRLERSVAEVTEAHVVEPVAAVLERHRDTRQALDSILT